MELLENYLNLFYMLSVLFVTEFAKKWDERELVANKYKHLVAGIIVGVGFYLVHVYQFSQGDELISIAKFSIFGWFTLYVDKYIMVLIASFFANGAFYDYAIKPIGGWIRQGGLLRIIKKKVGANDDPEVKDDDRRDIPLN